MEAVVDAFPFGRTLFNLAGQAIEIASGVATLYNPAARNINFLHELIKLLFSAVMLDLLKELCKMFLGADSSGDPKAKGKYVFSTLLAVVLSTLAAGIIYQAIETNIASGWSLTIEILFFIGILVAGVFVFLSKFSLKESILYGIAKYLVLNSLIIELYGFFILVIFESIQEGITLQWILFYGGAVFGFLVAIIVLSYMMDKVFS
jgi:hypothetical protein